jgi:LmbE family N-acetylglucosaminyl deacetylase
MEGSPRLERASRLGHFLERRFTRRRVEHSSGRSAVAHNALRAAILLREIADVRSATRIEASDAAIIVAHPDDETIGCGATLARLDGASLVVVTDGAPRAGADAARAGFASSSDYRAARAAELRSALAVAGVAPHRLVEFGLSDQSVCSALAPLTHRLASFFESRGVAVAFIHAFEGGHPDHDGIAFCARAAVALLGPRAPALIEMPYYHLGDDGASMVAQRFCDGDDGIIVDLPDRLRLTKEAMTRAHASQEAVLRGFRCDSERYRLAKTYDFRSLPNAGRIFYATFDSGFAPQDWAATARAALCELRLDGAPRRWFSFA